MIYENSPVGFQDTGSVFHKIGVLVIQEHLNTGTIEKAGQVQKPGKKCIVLTVL